MHRTLLVLVLPAALSVTAIGLWRCEEREPPGVPAEGPRPAATPRKLALLVGISKYDRGRGQPPDWWDLHSQKDVDELKSVLVDSFGFADKDVCVLTDEKATRKGIEDAFRSHLVEQAGPGAIVHFHYSGHGQQIPDDNGDEWDGLDESLVTHDYISQHAKDGDKTNLRDDRLGELLKQLWERMAVAVKPGQKKLEGSITVTLDCCFSGTATRGTPPAGRLPRRGRGWLVDLDGPLPPPNSRGKTNDASGLLVEGEAAERQYVVLSATRSDQLAAEYYNDKMELMGAFTHFLVRELKAATPKTTWRAVFQRIDTQLTARVRDQDPQIEGNGEKLVFQGTAVPHEPYVVVREVAGDVLTLPLGEVHGATAGSLFHVFKERGDLKNPADKVAEAEVTDVQGAKCSARVTEPFRGKVGPDALKGAQAVEVEHAYGESLLKVLLDPDVPASLADAARKVKAVQTAGVTGHNYDVRVRLDPKSKQLVLERKTSVFARIETRVADKAAAELREDLLAEWRAQFLLELRNPDEDSLVQVDIRAVPGRVELNKQGAVVKAVPREDFKDGMGQSQLTVAHGDYVMLEVRNRSVRLPAHVTILHFKPDGSVYCLFPEFADEDNKFAPDATKWQSLGKRFVFQAHAIKDQAGNFLGTPAVDIFKVIATREQTNYSQVLPSGGREQRAPEQVRGTVRGLRAAPRGQRATAYDLGRLLGKAALGEDPDPNNPVQRSERVPVVVTDWNTTAVKVITPQPAKK